MLDVVILINMILGVEPENYTTGDLNSDGIINILDITNAICEILSNVCIAECNWYMNHDTELNVLDIIIIMNNIINNY